MCEPISIFDAGRQIQSGRLTPLDLVERCLEQVRKYEDRVHAWVVVDEEGARRAARRLGEEVTRGSCRGPLHGVPVGIKDIIDVEGLPTRAGSPLRENVPAARSDAPVAAALRRAGAVILGKTVTVEFACFDPSPSRNPWDPQLNHTPGGSSSGSAVAVAMRMCPAAIGTQTGGSLVRPASYCGIATCKPTFGRVDKTAVVPVSYHLDHVGPMARTVEDLEILLAHLPASDDFGPPRRQPASEEAFDGTRPPRLGLVEPFFMEEADEPIRRAVEGAVGTLRGAGATIAAVELPEAFGDVNEVHTRVMAVEAAQYHHESFARDRQAYGPMITSLLDRGLSITGVEYAQALADLRGFRRQVGNVVGALDALIMPATNTTAPPTLETTGDKKFQAPWSCSGFPVVSLPCGLASDGMPAAVQLVGRYHEEAGLLRVARWCEACFDFREVPPLLAG